MSALDRALTTAAEVVPDPHFEARQTRRAKAVQAIANFLTTGVRAEDVNGLAIILGKRLTPAEVFALEAALVRSLPSAMQAEIYAASVQHVQDAPPSYHSRPSNAEYTLWARDASNTDRLLTAQSCFKAMHPRDRAHFKAWLDASECGHD